jgi:hypothetical protein
MERKGILDRVRLDPSQGNRGVVFHRASQVNALAQGAGGK